MTRRQLLAALAVAGLGAACEHVGTVTKAVGHGLASAGVVSHDTAEHIGAGAEEMSKGFQDFTPEQEYYIGRSVGALIVQRYAVYDQPEATEYVNVLGQTLAAASDYPQTWGGYHALLLDSDEINAFAAPGGLIFLSRGMVRCCATEDELAAVLAHEIGHVQRRHGLQAIQKSRITSGLTKIAVAGGKQMARADLVQLTSVFEDSLKDITQTMVNNGYSRAFEREADETAVIILGRVGYDKPALVTMLETMDRQLIPGGLDFAKTHPAPKDRIAEIVRYTGKHRPPLRPARQARFDEFLAQVA